MTPDIWTNWPRFGALVPFLISLPPRIRWRLSGTRPSMGARRPDWSLTFLLLYLYLGNRRGDLSASVPEIGVNWPLFGALVPFPIRLPQRIRWCLSGTLPSMGARRLDWSWTFSLLSIYLGYRGGVLCAAAPEIGVNWPRFGALVPFPISLPLGIRWRLSGTLPSMGAMLYFLRCRLCIGFGFP